MTTSAIATWEQIESSPTDATNDIRLAIRNAKTFAAGIRWEDFFPFPSAASKADRVLKIAEIKADPAKRETVTNRLIDQYLKAEKTYTSARTNRPTYTNRPTLSEVEAFGDMLSKRAIVARWITETEAC